jgi:hypothetical protein
VTLGGGDGDIKANFGEGAWGTVVDCGIGVGLEGNVEGTAVWDVRDDAGRLGE